MKRGPDEAGKIVHVFFLNTGGICIRRGNDPTWTTVEVKQKNCSMIGAEIFICRVGEAHFTARFAPGQYARLSKRRAFDPDLGGRVVSFVVDY